MHAREQFRPDVDTLLAEVDVLVSPTSGSTAPGREPDFERGSTEYTQGRSKGRVPGVQCRHGGHQGNLGKYLTLPVRYAV